MAATSCTAGPTSVSCRHRTGCATSRAPCAMPSRSSAIPTTTRSSSACRPASRSTTQRNIRRSSSATTRCGSPRSATSTWPRWRRRRKPRSPPVPAPPNAGRADRPVAAASDSDILGSGRMTMADQRPNKTRTIAAGMIGNILEWYDFSVYGYFAAQIGSTFFPREDPVAQVLAAFGIFAVGYVMRPLGGALTGHIGDRLGRRAALTFSVVAMAVPTVLVGLLPGYESLGLAAQILLTLLRVI